MFQLFIYLLTLLVAASITIADCKHRNHEILYPGPINEHLNDDILKHIHHHPRKRVDEISGKEYIDGEVRETLPDIKWRKKHNNDEDYVRKDDHISIEYDDKRKLDIDEKRKVTPIHKIIKKDQPDWLEEKHDLNWNDKTKLGWKDEIDYKNKDWVINKDPTNWERNDGWNNKHSHHHDFNHKIPETRLEIKKDDSDLWRDKKEVIKYDVKDVERKVWENNNRDPNWDNNNYKKLDNDKYEVIWNDKDVNYDKLNNHKHETDLIYKKKKDLNIYIPEITFNRNKDKKSGLSHLTDNIRNFVRNTTRNTDDNLHKIQSDLLNVKLDLKPLISLKTEKQKIKKEKDSDVEWKDNLHDGNRDVWLIKKGDEDDPKWLNQHHTVNLDNKHDHSNWGVIDKNKFVKVQDEIHETDWNSKKNDYKRLNIDVRTPEWDDGTKKLKIWNKPTWKISSGDDNDDETSI